MNALIARIRKKRIHNENKQKKQSNYTELVQIKISNSTCTESEDSK